MSWAALRANLEGHYCLGICIPLLPYHMHAIAPLYSPAISSVTLTSQASIGEEGGPSNSLPWVLGAHPGHGGFQFGVLFNSPALGGVALNASAITWSIMQDAGNQHVRQQFDFLVVTHEAGAAPADKPFQIVEKYVDAVGHARKLPWTGYWHSKNRYSSQEELLAVARGFHNRSIPVDVLVIDWFHWKIMGCGEGMAPRTALADTHIQTQCTIMHARMHCNTPYHPLTSGCNIETVEAVRSTWVEFMQLQRM